MSRKEIKSGSGFVKVYTDTENKYYYKIDFDARDDYDPTTSFFSPDSIIFYTAKSYYANYKLLLSQITNILDTQGSFDKNCGSLIIPFIFSFRHYVELMLKGLFVSLTRKSSNNTHNLSSLINDFFTFKNDFKIKKELKLNPTEIEKIKNEIINKLKKLSTSIKQYEQIEQEESYFRYLFDVNCDFDRKILEVNFDELAKLFELIKNQLIEIMSDVRKIADIWDIV